MRQTILNPRTSSLIASLLALSFVLLAVFQYRWLGEVSAAQRERLQTALADDAARFSDAVDRELSLLYALFQPAMLPQRGHPPGDVSENDLAERLGHARERYRELSARRDLLEMVLTVYPQDDGFAFRALDGGALVPCDDEPAVRITGLLPDHPHAPVPSPYFLDAVPALVVPSFGIRGRWGDGGRSRGGPPDGGRRMGMGRRHSAEPAAEPLPPPVWLALVLDREVLTGELLPALAARYFGSGQEIGYHVAVLARETGEEVFKAGPSVDAAARSSGADLEVGLFGLLAYDDLRALLAEIDGDEGVDADADARARMRSWLALASQRPEPRWTLRVTHPSGSLEAALAAAHRRNLLISTAVLAVLATALTVLLWSARRSQQLARQQLEFVAGVTHELLTPLAAMRSAGQNLADGVVKDPEKTRRYGALIDREGRRLSDMVRRVLDFAGIQSGQRSYAPERVDVGDVLRESHDEYRVFLDEKGFEVALEVDADLPPVMVDREALRRAFSNLVGNAVKYASAGAWLGLTARKSGRGVEVRVADRGPGIDREDLPHLFDPFYRGRRMTAANVPGSGLGLALVRHVVDAHGGRVRAESDEDGTAFILWLPGDPHA